MQQKILEKYEIIKEQEITDIQAVGALLRHKKSGARVALISCSDKNKVFSIAFRTPPEDSTGVAHILEHSVLCGSKNFPLKDPFVELVKGSLNTFLNAMTYPDKTVYPVASCNEQDFQNLMHIYLDAVFYPNVYEHEEIFRQEGWSYELSDHKDELVYNGVVYNEMKGAFSSPDGVLERQIMNSLYPDTCYGVESGGDPQHIPELTYEQFLDFHSRYYHPSNSYIYLYGDMDMEEKLDFLDREYLSSFDAIELNSQIKEQKPFFSIRDLSLSYPVGKKDPTEEKTFLSWQKVIGNNCDVRKMLAFDVLDYCLLSSSGSPIEKALLDAGIGNDIYGTFETDLMQPFFSITAKNADAAQKEEFIRIVEKTLRDQVKNGLSEKAILAGINYEEFRAREADFGRYPKGLIYLLSMFSTWLYDDTMPFDNIMVLDHYAWLRTQTKTGYFENLIQTELLDNPHGSVIVLSPEPGLAAKRDAAVKAELKAYRESLSDEGVKELIEKTQSLRAYQEEEDTPENIAKIPLLKRSDLKREIMPARIYEDEKAPVRTLVSNEKTNGIVYLQLLFDITDLPKEILPFTGILQGVFGAVDTESHTYDALPHEVNLHTGGIEFGRAAYEDFEGRKDRDTRYMKAYGKALYAETDAIFSLIKEIVMTSKFDDAKRLKEILEQGLSRQQMKFLTSGHMVAVLRAEAYDGDEWALLREYTGGIAYYQIIKDLAENFEERKNDLIRLLTLLARIVFTKDRLLVHVNAEEDEMEKMDFHAKTEAFLDGLYEKADTSLIEEVKALSKKELKLSGTDTIPCGNEAFSTASEVQYVARGGCFDRNRFPFTGAMHIFRTIMNYGYLWENLRVTGGAYGCMSMLTREGRGYFVSYRDPHLARTNEIYDGIPAYLSNFEADERTMTKYIIGTLSTIDIPLSAEQAGARSLMILLTNTDEEEIQKERNQLLDCTAEDIRALTGPVEEILLKNHYCVIGGEEKIKNAADLFDKIEELH